MDIGGRIREIREDLGMPRTALARRVGVADNTIWRIEAGQRTPSVGLLEKIAHELRTVPAALMQEQGGIGQDIEEVYVAPPPPKSRSADESSPVEIDVDPRAVEGGVPAEVLVVNRDALVQAMERVRDHEWSVEDAERELERLGYLWGPLREQVRKHARWGE